MSEIKIKIKDQEYTTEEAREIYNELRQIFSPEPMTYIPFVQPVVDPYAPSYPLYPPITYSGETETHWYKDKGI